jgi:hypothetical protein
VLGALNLNMESDWAPLQGDYDNDSVRQDALPKERPCSPNTADILKATRKQLEWRWKDED